MAEPTKRSIVVVVHVLMQFLVWRGACVVVQKVSLLYKRDHDQQLGCFLSPRDFRQPFGSIKEIVIILFIYIQVFISKLNFMFYIQIYFCIQKMSFSVKYNADLFMRRTADERAVHRWNSSILSSFLIPMATVEVVGCWRLGGFLALLSCQFPFRSALTSYCQEGFSFKLSHF